ncbi:hypothetical protein [Sodalinema gerasimenkoae]|uniref:hypothetical protein n=1 Tax=Sodalinema gerasimenkoae TaxID=2862348 RepID=UPI001356CBED|nr:hypothetical protein [Sodalinema gerasimenkoae]
MEILVHGNHYGIAQILEYWRHLYGWNHLQYQVEHSFLETKVQNHLFKHPEFFGYGWEPVAKNQSLQTVIEKLDGKIDRHRKELQTSADLVFRKGNQLIVVEIMRPSLRADMDHLARIQLYHNYLDGFLKTYNVRGIFIAKEALDPGVSIGLSKLPKIDIQFLTWHQFIERTRPELKLDVIWLIDSAVNQIAGLLPPAPEPSFS